MISLFVQQNGLVLSQIKTAGKGGALAGILELLGAIDLKNAAENLRRLRRMALNLLKNTNPRLTKRTTIEDRRKIAAGIISSCPTSWHRNRMRWPCVIRGRACRSRIIV